MTKLTEKVQDKKETLSELDAREATLKRALTSKREKLSKLTMQHEIRVKDLKVTIEAMSRSVTFSQSDYDVILLHVTLSFDRQVEKTLIASVLSVQQRIHDEVVFLMEV